MHIHEEDDPARLKCKANDERAMNAPFKREEYDERAMNAR